MKKIVQSAFLIALISITSITISISEPTGSPRAATGSPTDGATCSQNGCHSGTPVNKTGILTSNIPNTGYVPGTTYIMTVTVTGTSSFRKGFQVSPQKDDGTLLGTLVAGTGTKFSPSNKYITHSSAKTGASATWTFNWTAPAKGTGPVDFYGAFAINTNTTYKEKVTYQEGFSTGMSESSANFNLNVYPNPMQDNINLSFDLHENAAVSAQLISIDGKNFF